LAGLLTRVRILPGRLVFEPSVAGGAARVEVGPIVGEPVVAGMVGPIEDRPFRPEVLDLPSDFRERCLAIGALAVEQAFESEPDRILAIEIGDLVPRSLT